MQSPSNRSVTSEVDTPTSSKSSDSQNIANSPSRSPSPKKNTSKLTAKNENTNNIIKKINHKNIIKSNPPPPTTEQTPTRFLAACSKLDLEPNPFEQSFSGVASHSEGTGQSTPKPILPSVAQLTSPSPGNDYWNMTQSLRSGPLSPSMLEGPQEPILFNSTILPNGRTGTTPLPFGSFSEQSSTRSTTIFGAVSGNSFVNSSASLNLSAANNMFSSQGVLMDSDRKTVATSKTIGKPLINSVPNITVTADNNKISSTQSTDLSNGSTNVMITNQIGHQTEPLSPQDKINSHNHHKSVPRRRKTDDFPMGEQSPTKKSNQKTKNELTDEEKRRNFLERNRQAALKCRQRKKQWLANLQAKVEFLTNDNENLQNQAQSLREEIFNLKTLLLAHKDCPITQASGGLTLDTITSGIGGMQPSINSVPINIGVGMVPNPMQAPQNQSVQQNGVHVQIPQNMPNHGPPGSGMLRY
ncbi:14964_t:CDS:2 [Entrophospora sp. SA101]|nr:1090_t:CDS:2 [Entrophospora sp. SA101]CAJ0647547.1 4337_t:CDS:2 [Entrophospora sp. SA101]CAJ0748367.1 23951_t:CDS:2 [Entrophospora sp. SA101]CAJ0759115.1 14964_t:CDS:2 [Entrophospora sp. SA101]CAJ0839120.1 4844_t:CDS:2 [Entrophospora sp. SA101]